MLAELSIRNVAIIEDVHIVFSQGFHVFTGETGAGKSILIDALQWVIGGRASADLVRHGAERAQVEALFFVQTNHPAYALLIDQGIDVDEGVIVRREVTVAGKSTARINGQLVPLTLLRAIGDTLVTIHGQQDHQQLLRADRQLSWLDAFGGASITEKRETYRAYDERLRDVTRRMAQLQKDHEATRERLDWVRYQLEEIAQAQLQEGEDVVLLQKKRKLVHAEKRHQAVARSYSALFESAHNALGVVNQAVQALAEAVPYDESVLASVHEQLSEAYYHIEDVAQTLRVYRDGIDFQTDELEAIEDRLQRITALKKKHGDTIAAIIAKEVSLRESIDAVEHHEHLLEGLNGERVQVLESLRQVGQELSTERRNQAEAFSAHVLAQLQHLNMERTRFMVAFESVEVGEMTQGCDRIEFMIAPNAGEPMKPLAKIASGGECSRIMLALKTVLAKADPVTTLIFDEVDTGVSGRAAQAIAEQLAQVAQEAQVFAVTHLPQVACMADHHYAIVKSEVHGRTVTTVQALPEAGRLQEIARMIGGVAVTDTTEHHAREMVQMAQEHKTAVRARGM